MSDWTAADVEPSRPGHLTVDVSDLRTLVCVASIGLAMALADGVPPPSREEVAALQRVARQLDRHERPLSDPEIVGPLEGAVSRARAVVGNGYA